MKGWDSACFTCMKPWFHPQHLQSGHGNIGDGTSTQVTCGYKVSEFCRPAWAT